MSAEAGTARVDSRAPRGRSGAPHISRVPYLPGLDGMRAFAVAAVLVYHANSDWLKGGFFGVEVFFVISGYLITLLLIAEKERSDRVDMKQFWMRRGRRLLPALFTMMILLTVWTAIFRSEELGKLRGDVVAGVFYVSNWYQIFVGASYADALAFAPLRHLWSLAVEEQFYLLWPLVMVALLRSGSRRVADLSRWLFLAAVAVTVVVALLYHPGPIGTPEVTPEAYWQVGDRFISKADFLYLSTPTRAAGLLLGSAFAMIWRPVAVMRGPMRTKHRPLDAIALAAFVLIAIMSVNIGYIDENGADPWLFRGGFFVCSLFTIGIIAAVTHERTITSRVLAVPLLLWIGTRSYGLYLYSWPIFQMIRDGGRGLTAGQFAGAMLVTVVIVELSYRFIETPIRRGALGATWRRVRDRRDPGRRTAVLTGAFAGTALTIFAAGSLATADLQQTEYEQTQRAGAAAACDVLADPDCGVGEPEPTVATTVVADAAPGAATTEVPVPTTEPPPPPIERLAIGDSVMVGAIPALNELGFVVDAKESLQFRNGVELVQELQATDRLGEVLVVHLGTNGPFGEEDMDAMMVAVADVPTVLLLTNDVDRDYTSGNNALIYDAVNQYPNVQLLDWQGLAGSCAGDCFYSDDIHLRPEGSQYYADLVAGVLGLR